MRTLAQNAGPRGLVGEQGSLPADFGSPIARQWESVGIPIVVLGWIAVVLYLDADGSLTTQRVLGALTWLLLAAALWTKSASVRMQTLIVVLIATAVEYICSPLLEVYIYRLDNVPAYVPPGHGLVYLTSMAIGSSVYVRAHERTCTAAVVAVGGAWAVWGLSGSDRIDVLGAFWFGCLVAFLLWGPNRPLYIGACVVVSYLEIVGTTLGVWQWQPYDLTGLIPTGNPPSGSAGGYGWFDLAALLIAPRLLAWLRPASGSAAGVGADHGIRRLIAVSDALVSRRRQPRRASSCVHQVCTGSGSTRVHPGRTDPGSLGAAAGHASRPATAPWPECWSALGVAAVPKVLIRDREPPIRGPCDAGEW